MAHSYKLAVVTGGLAGCAMVIRAERKGMANDNFVNKTVNKVFYLSVNNKKNDSVWPEGLRHHTAVLMNVTRGKTLVKVVYPLVG